MNDKGKRVRYLFTGILIALATLTAMFMLVGSGKAIKLIVAAAIVIKIAVLRKKECSIMRTSILFHLLLVLLYPDYWLFIAWLYLATLGPLLFFRLVSL